MLGRPMTEEVCTFLVPAFCRFSFQTKLACFNEIPVHQKVNDLME